MNLMCTILSLRSEERGNSLETDLTSLCYTEDTVLRNRMLQHLPSLIFVFMQNKFFNALFVVFRGLFFVVLVTLGDCPSFMLLQVYLISISVFLGQLTNMELV